MRAIVFGAGRQGLAIAFDLLHSGAKRLTLVDTDAAALARHGLERVDTLHAPASGSQLAGHDVAVSALPYSMNPTLARAAVEHRVHFCDLGGNTELVLEALELDEAAREAGVTIVPDCGLAPGLGNVLAAIGIDAVPNAQHVRIRCGGLPLEPRGPLGYELLFSVGGLTNEYRGEAVVIRDGRIQRFEAFTECEPFGTDYECFFTSGGTSTAPWRHEGKLQTYEYKTIRYPGHFDKMRAMIDLGLLDLETVEVDGAPVSPRALWHAVAGPRLIGDGKDVAILSVEVEDDRGAGIHYELRQEFDAETGFTAMEQTTGFPTAAIAAAIVRGELRPGAYTPDAAGFGPDHIDDLRTRGLNITVSEDIPRR